MTWKGPTINSACHWPFHPICMHFSIKNLWMQTQLQYQLFQLNVVCVCWKGPASILKVFKVFICCSQNLWLGGYKDAEGKAVTGFEKLKSYLRPNFELIEDKPMSFFIRETAHKNQWSVAHTTIWKRRPYPEILWTNSLVSSCLLPFASLSDRTSLSAKPLIWKKGESF